MEITVKDNTQVTLSPALPNMMGLKQAIFQTGNHVADIAADVNQVFNSLYVYCPMVESIMVGYVSRLRIVPVYSRSRK